MKKLLLISTAIILFNFAKAQKVFSVDYQSQADVKVYVVKYESQADLKIYFVDYESQAGWKKSSKKSLMY